jgi:hypothetical protein
MTAQLTTSLYGGVSASTTYYVYSKTSSAFTVTDTSNGLSPITLTTDTGNMSVAAVGWDHIIPGYPIESLLTSSSLYFIEPRTLYSEPAFTQSSVTLVNQNSNNYSNIAYGNNYFVAIASNSSYAAISQNGSTWTAEQSQDLKFNIN